MNTTRVGKKEDDDDPNDGLIPLFENLAKFPNSSFPKRDKHKTQAEGANFEDMKKKNSPIFYKNQLAQILLYLRFEEPNAKLNHYSPGDAERRLFRGR